MSLRALSLLTLTLGACSTDTRVEYYDGTPPSISGLSANFEDGNLGGNTITINGSGFGSDLAEVVVQVGSLNAEILSLADSAIEIVTPKGPIEGGPVDISVATAGGQTAALDVYTYEVSDVYDEQDAYILANNYWYSCFGGRDTLGVNAGCESISYIGNVGIDGYAEFFNFAFPRKHSTSYGWFGGSDWSPGEWSVQTPAYRPFASGVDELRQTLGNFNLHNRVLEGQGWCVDTTVLGSWYYGGTDEYNAFTYTGGDSLLFEGADSQVGCEELPNGRWYALADLNFCEVQEYEENHSNDYQADWPVGLPFFVPAGEGVDSDATPPERLASCRNGVDDDGDAADGQGADGLDTDCHPKIAIDLPEAGINGVELSLPEPVLFRAEQGIDTSQGESLAAAALRLFDDDDDGSTELDNGGDPLSLDPQHQPGQHHQRPS
ncbi:MAG: IPT/TIG domain-containing protein [Alphaproteobacteria bacterium]|nr:IPT/TIG domain-containing protein [Alphaproteobacteria bacterium]